MCLKEEIFLNWFFFFTYYRNFNKNQGKKEEEEEEAEVLNKYLWKVSLPIKKESNYQSKIIHSFLVFRLISSNIIKISWIFMYSVILIDTTYNIV